jgi:hypothetical protein
MKVDISQKEDKTLFGRVTGIRVTLGVTFSQEELAIINSKKLKEVIVYDYPDEQFGTMETRIKDLMKQTIGKTCPNLVEAREFTEMLRDKMKVLKSFIDANGQEMTNESFEL